MSKISPIYQNIQLEIPPAKLPEEIVNLCKENQKLKLALQECLIVACGSTKTLENALIASIIKTALEIK